MLKAGNLIKRSQHRLVTLSQTLDSNCMSLAPSCMCVYVCVSSAELQLVVEQHFQRHEQTEAGLSDSPDTPSPIAAQQPNGAAAQWANHSSQESYVSCDGQAESSEAGGKWRSEPRRNEKTFPSASVNT